MNVTQPRGVGNWFDCHAIVVSLKGRSQYRWAGAFLIAAFKLSNLIAFGRHRIAAVSPKLLKFLIRKSGTAIAKYLTSGTLRHEHSMTNMTSFSIALLGQHRDAVSPGDLFYNLLWGTLGNANAGSVFRGAAYWVNGKASTSTATVTIPSE